MDNTTFINYGNFYRIAIKDDSLREGEANLPLYRRFSISCLYLVSNNFIAFCLLFQGVVTTFAAPRRPKVGFLPIQTSEWKT